MARFRARVPRAGTVDVKRLIYIHFIHVYHVFNFLSQLFSIFISSSSVLSPNIVVLCRTCVYLFDINISLSICSFICSLSYSLIHAIAILAVSFNSVASCLEDYIHTTNAL